MAKPLVFDFNGSTAPFSMSKVDRSKLYGYKEMEVLSEKSEKCELATLSGDGRTVVGKGGTAFAYLSPDGTWRDRGHLEPVDLQGETIKPVASSFSAPVPLAERATMDDYLEHNIRLVYQLSPEEDAGPLLAELEQGAVFKFPYSFRGGLVADAGFLLQAEDGNIFLAVGNPTKLEFIGLQQSTGFVETDEGEEEEEEDLMDFDMI